MRPAGDDRTARAPPSTVAPRRRRRTRRRPRRRSPRRRGARRPRPRRSSTPRNRPSSPSGSTSCAASCSARRPRLSWPTMPTACSSWPPSTCRSSRPDATRPAWPSTPWPRSSRACTGRLGEAERSPPRRPGADPARLRPDQRILRRRRRRGGRRPRALRRAAPDDRGLVRGPARPATQPTRPVSRPDGGHGPCLVPAPVPGGHREHHAGPELDRASSRRPAPRSGTRSCGPSSSRTTPSPRWVIELGDHTDPGAPRDHRGRGPCVVDRLNGRSSRCGSSMMSVAPRSLRAGINTFTSVLGTTVSTAYPASARELRHGRRLERGEYRHDRFELGRRHVEFEQDLASGLERTLEQRQQVAHGESLGRDPRPTWGWR